MAKIAFVRYGSEGQGPANMPMAQYAYVVNDNVRTKQKLQVISTQHVSGTKFVTTALVEHTMSETSVEGMKAKQDINNYLERNEQKGRAKQMEKAYTSKELGVKGKKEYETDPVTGKKQPSQFLQANRGAVLAKYAEEHPNESPAKTFSEKAYETFESYSSKFTNKGEQ